MNRVSLDPRRPRTLICVAGAAPVSSVRGPCQACTRSASRPVETSRRRRRSKRKRAAQVADDGTIAVVVDDVARVTTTAPLRRKTASQGRGPRQRLRYRMACLAARHIRTRRSPVEPDLLPRVSLARRPPEAINVERAQMPAGNRPCLGPVWSAGLLPWRRACRAKSR